MLAKVLANKYFHTYIISANITTKNLTLGTENSADVTELNKKFEVINIYSRKS